MSYDADASGRDGPIEISGTASVEAQVQFAAALFRERARREEAERRLIGLLDLVAERHERKRRQSLPALPASEVGTPQVDDVVRAKARKALRNAGFVRTKP